MLVVKTRMTVLNRRDRVLTRVLHTQQVQLVARDRNVVEVLVVTLRILLLLQKCWRIPVPKTMEGQQVSPSSIYASRGLRASYSA